VEVLSLQPVLLSSRVFFLGVRNNDSVKPPGSFL